MATIKQIKDTNGNVHDILTMVGWGTCPTAAATAAKVATIEDTSWTLRVGSIVGIKYTNTNTAGSSTTPVTLNVNNTGAKNIVYAGSAYTSTSSSICGYAGRTIYYMYDGTNWVWFNMGSLDGNSNTVPCIQIETAAATAAKVGTCTNYSLLAKSYAHANVRYSNTSKTALTLNVNSKGAKSIYINGSASSTSNYTLPAGTYIIYYDGTNYHFRTDGVLPNAAIGNGKITIKQAGTEKGSFTVNQTDNINIELTDNNTTYTFATGDSNGQIKVTPSGGGSATNISVKGLGSLAYKNSLSASDVGASPSNHNHDSAYAPKTHNHDDIYVKKSGDTMTGNLTLHSDSGDSPYLKFNRGTTADNLCDWTIIDSGGYLRFKETINGTTTEVLSMCGSGGKIESKLTIKAPTFDGTATNATNATNATTATNLAAKPSLSASGNNITVTAGGKTSDAFTVPYATTANTAINLEPSPSLSASGNNITVTAGGKTSDEFTVPYATNATNDGGGNNISATYALKADFEGFTEYVESDFVKKTSSLKNPNAIKFKNTSGTVITYDGSSAADLSGGVYYAATAGSATSATSASSATTATNANNVKVNTTSSSDGLPILLTTAPSTYSSINGTNRAVYVDSTKSFYYAPSTNYVYAGGFFETSDERLKDIVKPISVDLDQLSKLRKVYFNWKDKPESAQQLGMIAQDVQEIYPELVSEMNGKLSLSYEKLSVVALEAIDVLHNENNELKSRIERLESLVNQLAEKVND